MTDLTTLSISDALVKLRAGEISSIELTQAYLDRIDQFEPQVQAYITVTPEHALMAAKAADEAYANGEARPLQGIPMAIKDILSTEGIDTTCGSQILKGYRPIYNATCVQQALDAGIVTLGKANLDEFAMGSSTENSGYHVSSNPWDLSRVAGGSSGGSAAAVSARLAAAALGTDTGGSIRQPSAFCGVVGLKPTYGRVSRHGLIAYGSSLDCAGPIGITVEDTARILQVIAGYDPLDSTTMNVPVPDYVAALTGDIKGVKIGVPKEFFIEGVQPATETAVRAALDHLAGLGAELIDVSLPHTEYAVPVYYIVAPAEASANLARYDGIRFGPVDDRGDMWDTYRTTRGGGFGSEVKRRIMLGTYALSAGYYDAYYGKAQQVRTLIKRDFDQVFEQVDLVAMPVAPHTAWKIGEKAQDPLAMYLEDIFTLSANLAGTPGISVTCGFDENNLPIGIQLIGAQFQEETILRAAHAYEQTTDWQERQPVLQPAN